MIVIKYSSVLVLIVFACTIQNGYGLDENAGTRALLRVYDDCHKIDGGIIQCLKKKAVTFLDRVNRIDIINVADGLKVIKNENDSMGDESARALSETELDETLPRGLEARDEALTNLLLERVARFFSSRTIQFTLPKVTSNEISRSFEEGRGKKNKKMMGMMMMGFAMKMAAMVPVALAGLYILAGKALIVSKIAFLLAAIIGLKKLLSGKQSGGGGGGGGGWSSGGGSQGWSQGGGGGHGGGGWEQRSLDAHNIVYNAHKQ